MTSFPSNIKTKDNILGTNQVSVFPTVYNSLDDELIALQTKIGVDSSAVATSLDYKVTTLETNQTDHLPTTTTATELNLLHDNLGAWASWIPTWTNLTIGDAIVNAKYSQIGKTVKFWVSVVLGAGTSVGSIPIISLPTSISQNANIIIGLTRYYDATGSIILGAFTGGGHLQVYNASATYTTLDFLTAIVPFTWTTGDAIWLSGTYESA